MKIVSIEITPKVEALLTQFLHTDTMGTNRPIFIVRDRLDHCEDCDPDCDGERCKEHVDKSFHFSLEEARRYRNYQKHNLSDPYIYAQSPGYSNDGDFIPFYDLLRTVARSLERSEYHVSKETQEEQS